jgi:hypothetical protein
MRDRHGFSWLLTPVLGTLALNGAALAQVAAAPSAAPETAAAADAPPPSAAPETAATAEAPPSPEPTPLPETSPAPVAGAQDQKALEAEFQTALASEPTSSVPAGPPAPAARGGATLSLLDLSFDLLGAGGGSTASEPHLRELEGGGHDPKTRGFTIQNVELTYAGVVDPYLRGDANIVLQIDPSGATTVELEEAYLTSLDLPFNLQLKAGQFFGAFGRLNATHPHTWDFVDAPVVNSRLLGGDGFRNPGAQLSWLTPLPFFAELLASMHNAQGETAASFRSAPGEVVAGRTLIDRSVHGLNDFVYLLRLRTSFDLGDEITIVPGVSALFGPNATALDTTTQIYGADLYFKWKPLSNDQGWPYVAWQSEGILRRYDAAGVLDRGMIADRRKTLRDWGAYSQLIWGFARPFNIGVRYDFARGENDTFTVAGDTYSAASDPLRDRRERVSGVLTYYPSEFSKIRLQYNFDHTQFLPERDAHSVYVQAEILFGAHGAHKF